ncbi:MAG: hypothetical protein E7042_06300 [Lentisphaerae bacterium]|nr:hypothetical protein [Lentisphaerota bacterium]
MDLEGVKDFLGHGIGKIKAAAYAAVPKLIEKDGFEAVLALIEYGKQKSWLLSGWKTNMPDANGEVGTHSAATQLEPTFSRQELGAGINNIIQNFQNPSVSKKIRKKFRLKNLSSRRLWRHQP